MKRNQGNSLFNKSVYVLIYFIFIISLVSCSSSKYFSQTNYQFKNTSGKPDYSNLDYWASHPWKTDAADNIPSSIQNKNNDSLADVFFIHPTTYTDLAMPMGWNADINNETLNKKTDNSTILYQASVFNEQCRIFAPRYRQANIKAFYTTNKEDADNAFDLAYDDIKAAFEYYLKHYNHGRPIIVASHSQGTLHAGRLLKEFFENKPLQKKLVCAYIIGLPVFTNYFKALQPCKDSTATGCFVGWRTFKEGYIAPFIAKEKEIAYVTNPLTWAMSEEFAPAKLNKGGILKKFNKLVPGVVSAQVHGNILWTSKPKFFGNIFLKTKNYHIADINLFYVNIRENVKIRIQSFLKDKIN